MIWLSKIKKLKIFTHPAASGSTNTQPPPESHTSFCTCCDIKIHVYDNKQSLQLLVYGIKRNVATDERW